MARDIYNNIDFDLTLELDTRTAGVEGDPVDLIGTESAVVVIRTTVVDDGEWTFTLEHTDDDPDGTPTWETVEDHEVQGEFVGATIVPQEFYRLGYLGEKRYIRLVVAVEEVTAGAEFEAFVVLGDLRHKPVGRVDYEE